MVGYITSEHNVLITLFYIFYSKTFLAKIIRISDALFIQPSNHLLLKLNIVYDLQNKTVQHHVKIWNMILLSLIYNVNHANSLLIIGNESFNNNSLINRIQLFLIHWSIFICSGRFCTKYRCTLISFRNYCIGQEPLQNVYVKDKY